MSSILLVNFGGPRSLEEIEPFLISLLTDVDVIRTSFPRFLEKWFFTRAARKRAVKIRHDYTLIGGKSPIFEDTESIAEEMRRRLKLPVITFHRYLPATHEESFRQIRESCTEFIVFPLYPQFSFATTGSIARFFAENLESKVLSKMRWIKSYATHPCYISAMQKCIADYLKNERLPEKDVVLFFSAHGLPREFVDQGDPYARECQLSFHAMKSAFPEAHSLLAFQSKFGRGEWLRPYTNELCEMPKKWHLGRQNIVFVPLSFTSDHIETLFEIEHQYLPAIRAHGLEAFRCPALNQREEWIQAMVDILQEKEYVENGELVRS
ncbi:MAG TPA: ferrochelatase [Candidatus Babeliaceae bacterium]|nr:ferrochelatase [Candidatus Babeliaceae bacterium]